MDSTDQAEIAAFIQEVDLSVMQGYCSTAAATLLVWHYLTTFDGELAFFWKRKFSGALLLYFANRYLPLFAYIYNSPWGAPSFADAPAHAGVRPIDRRWLHLPTNTHMQSCTANVTSQYIVQFSPYVVWAGISALRVHALRQRWSWTILVFLLSLVPVFCDAVLFSFMHPEIDPVWGCTLEYDGSLRTYQMYVSSFLPLHIYPLITAKPSLRACVPVDVAAYTAFVFGELIVVVITWAATSHRKGLGPALVNARSLSDTLYRNGVFYFASIMILNIVQLVFNGLSAFLPYTVSVVENICALLSFVGPLTSILITNFYIDLQEVAHAPGPSLSQCTLGPIGCMHTTCSTPGATYSPGTPREIGDQYAV
ncbi:hypothetical protein C8Q78DRAFT_1083618 [Trametes maxima]|nr:hypothetical protein C8Q78DRAFT_1083618 [Trametes maxima]